MEHTHTHTYATTHNVCSAAPRQKHTRQHSGGPLPAKLIPAGNHVTCRGTRLRQEISPLIQPSSLSPLAQPPMSWGYAAFDNSCETTKIKQKTVAISTTMMSRRRTIETIVLVVMEPIAESLGQRIDGVIPEG